MPFSNSLKRLNFVDVDNDTESMNLELRRFARNAYIGFSILDIIHIVCSVLVLIYIYANDAVHPIVAAECCVEIVFSLLLIAFIAALAKKSDHETFHALYTYSWLVAVASMLVPMTFAIPEIVAGNWADHYEAIGLTTSLVSMVLILISFLLLLATMFDWKNAVSWNKLIRVALVLVIVSSLAEFGMEFTLGKSNFELVVNCIKDLAPLVPAIMGLVLRSNAYFRE